MSQKEEEERERKKWEEVVLFFHVLWAEGPTNYLPPMSRPKISCTVTIGPNMETEEMNKIMLFFLLFL